jgi:hypothetical protein
MKLHCFCVINQVTTTTTTNESSLLFAREEKTGDESSKYGPNSFLHEKEYFSNYY